MPLLNRLVPTSLPLASAPTVDLRVLTFAIVYHVGSRNEAVGHTGATHRPGAVAVRGVR